MNRERPQEVVILDLMTLEDLANRMGETLAAVRNVVESRYGLPAKPGLKIMRPTAWGVVDSFGHKPIYAKPNRNEQPRGGWKYREHVD